MFVNALAKRIMKRIIRRKIKVLFIRGLVMLFFLTLAFGNGDWLAGVFLAGTIAGLIILTFPFFHPIIKKPRFEYDQYHPYTYSRIQAIAASPIHFTAKEWNDLCSQYHYCCVRCGKQKRLTADHIRPLFLGGSDGIENIQPLCKVCNSIKGTQYIDYRS